MGNVVRKLFRRAKPISTTWARIRKCYRCAKSIRNDYVTGGRGRCRCEPSSKIELTQDVVCGYGTATKHGCFCVYFLR